MLIFSLIRFKIVPSRSRKWKTGYLAFNWKKNFFHQTLTDDARHENVPFPFFWLESRSDTIKGMTEENSQKNGSNRYHMRKIVQLDWLKTVKHFSVNPRREFLSWQEASRWADEQASGFLHSDRYFSLFWAVTSAMYFYNH